MPPKLLSKGRFITNLSAFLAKRCEGRDHHFSSLFTQKLKNTKFDDTNERHRRHMNTRIYPMPLLLPPIVCDINYKLCSPKTIKNMNIHKQQNATNIKEDSRSHLNRSLHIHIGVWVMPGSVDHA